MPCSMVLPAGGARYLAARFYPRRFAIIVYEICAALLVTSVTIVDFVDADSLLSDPILFAVAFFLVCSLVCAYERVGHAFSAIGV